MTPLAQKLVSELTLPVKSRSFKDTAAILPLLPDAHCFELSAVSRVAKDLTKKLITTGVPASRLAFLPSPLTWIEWQEESGRVGYLLHDTNNGKAEVYATTGRGSVCLGAMGLLETVAEAGQDPDAPFLWFDPRFDGVVTKGSMLLLYSALALINTPRVVGRRQHMPHAGLQRKLARARGTVGKYPLHAWSEIELDIAPPRLDRSAVGEPHETRLTGAKALHFCRCHLRIRLGHLELVSAHWRGDPALGIKQTRYRMTNTRPDLEPVSA